jgi:hypothetical protein
MKRNTNDLVACEHDPCGLHHDDITADTLEEAYRIYNERADTGNTYGYTDFNAIHNDYAESINRHELDTQVDNIGNVITDDDWEVLQESVEDIENIVNNPSHLGKARRRKAISKNINAYLQSERASSLRRFMGKDIDTQEISNMITSNVQAMISPSKMGHTLTRVIFSRTGNDMNKRKYIASILFFGGRCCYCGKVIRKMKDGLPRHDSATTEHIDPMAGRPHGETKYGNVALCCEACNADKGNASFHDWMKDNTIMNDKQKSEAERRIGEFRKYTMYEPMSMKKSNNIDRIIAKAKNRMTQSLRENNKQNKSIRNEDKEIREKHAMEYRRRYKESIASIKRTAIQEAMMA